MRMDAISYSHARATLAKAMDRVCEQHEPLLITRQGRQTVVLLSLEDYESLEATAYLKRSPENARRLTEAIRGLDAGQGIYVDTAELAD